MISRNPASTRKRKKVWPTLFPRYETTPAETPSTNSLRKQMNKGTERGIAKEKAWTAPAKNVSIDE